jgi:hypothetical protein
MMLSDKERDALAKSVGANGYLTDCQQDFGGIVAFAFPLDKHLNKNIWMPYEDEETKKYADIEKYYIPAATFKTDILKAEETVSLNENPNIVVTGVDMKFPDVMFYFSREESAAMANVKLSTPSIEELGRKYGIDRKKINMLSLGAPVEAVEPSLTDEKKQLITIAQNEDNEIKTKLQDTKFRSILRLSGKTKAVEILRKMLQLKVVPAGTINMIAGCKSKEYSCGISKENDEYFISSPTPLDNADLVAVNEKH